MSLLPLPGARAIRATEVLAPERADALLAATMAERKWLVDASTGGRDDHRSAQLLYTPVDEAAEVLAWLRPRVDAIARALDIEAFEPRRTEMQITVHGDGDFYRLHRDDQGDDVAARTLSYLYYLHRRPRAFEGGELVLLDAERVSIEPVHNSIVVFASNVEHEVLPVRVPSGDLADGRFTVNGWLWR